MRLSMSSSSVTKVNHNQSDLLVLARRRQIEQARKWDPDRHVYRPLTTNPLFEPANRYTGLRLPKVDKIRTIGSKAAIDWSG